MRLHESGVDIVQHIRPDLSDVVHFVECLEGGVAERIGHIRRGVGVMADARGVVENELAEDKVGHGGVVLVQPAVVVRQIQGREPDRRDLLGKCIGPSFAQASIPIRSCRSWVSTLRR